MGEQPNSDLRKELGAEAAKALADLSDAEVERLLTSIRQAREAERKALREAAESSLSIVPRFARGAVKKIVFG